MPTLFSAAAFAALALPCASATAEVAAAAELACQQNSTPLTGVVRDTTLALIPGARITLDGQTTVTSGDDGRFRFPCVDRGTHRLQAAMDGFALDETQWKAPHAGDIQLTLKPDTVQIGVNVNADEQSIPSAQGTGNAQTLSGDQLQALADDPDDLQRQLQQLGAAAGGNPSQTTIAVDGFQGSSKLPPKSSIAYIKVNPDMFSAEYREPPFDGGRVEVYTKPGQPTFHGALFATNGSPWMNASDPFSTSKAPLGKQRYGFELSGPIRKQGSDFALSLEHRSIDSFGVVYATTLDANGNPVATTANVATPQRLWVGEARVDWQLGDKNTLIATYSPNVNSLRNVGVGGLNLQESGYNSGQPEHVLRFTDITTVSPRLMHEARASLRWQRETDTPNSLAPQVQVAGAFSGGGNTLGPQRLRIFNLEIDDDAIITTKAHTVKFGTEWMSYHEDLQLTTNFNGTYTFGGSSAAPVLDANGAAVAGQVVAISGLEQYRRALLHLPGGAPTAFSNVAGSPRVRFDQMRDSLYVQDDWNVGKGVHLASGVRYSVQNDPVLVGAVMPRAGVLWSPTKKGTWTLHAHAGLFVGQFGSQEWAEVLREDGAARRTTIGYNAAYCGVDATCDPYGGRPTITSQRTLAGGLTNGDFAIENVGGTRALPFGFNLSLDYYIARLWNMPRTLNINSPLNDDPAGPRALGVANSNILQVQNSAQGRANVTFAGIEQHQLKHLQMFFGGVRVNLVDDNDDGEFASPQSAFTNAGEFAHRSNQPIWNLFGNVTLNLPAKVVWSSEFNGRGDAHYNITTGFDNNGDGNFNDRPRYAAPGTPDAVTTRYGLLVASGGTGVFPRNQGVMPWNVYLDTNVQRAFALTQNPKADHPQVLTLNVRAVNVLNHTNVTAVGGVLGSPTFGQPYAADNGRRVEAGLRYSF